MSNVYEYNRLCAAQSFLQSHDGVAVEFGEGCRVVRRLCCAVVVMRERQAPWTASGRVVVIGGGELPELRPELAGQVTCIERDPSIGYRGFKRTDSIFFVLVLFVIHDSVLKAVALFHRTEGVVG